MYDDLTCKYPLPLPADLGELAEFDFSALGYQTKSLDKTMSYFEIRADGTLWEEKHEYKFVEGNPKGESIMDRLPYQKITKTWWEKQDITREIVFYEGIRDDKYKNDYWIEFKAIFIKGILETVELVKFEKRDNFDRKLNDRVWQDKMAKIFEFNKKWYVKYGYHYYAILVRKIFRLTGGIKDKFPPLWKIEGWLLPW